jgi:hypothetical protein
LFRQVAVFIEGEQELCFWPIYQAGKQTEPKQFAAGGGVEPT